jgi:Domain of unknown function (DUF4133)
MAGSIYPINKGINKSIEFRGLKAQYIWYLGGVVIGAMILFAILYIIGVSAYLCIPLVGGLGAAGIARVYRMSRLYGEYGLMKRLAQRNIPKVIHARSRRLFFQRFSIG